MARLTAAQGWSLTWVESIEWLDFIEEFIPDTQQHCRGKEGTLETDGWSSVNLLHLVPFMVNVNQELHTVKVYDTTTKVENAENLIAMICEVIQIVEKDWGILVIAITSDCGGDSRAAWKAVVTADTHLVGPNCDAHQINLIVGDYFNASALFLDYTDKADQVIRWLRGQTFLLGLLREIQQCIWEGQTLAVIRAVITRWMAHFLAYQRLLELKSALELLVEHPCLYASGTEQSHAVTRKMVPIICDGLFWHHLARVKFHLQPLAIAANVTQSVHCRLDEVLLTFAFLVKQYLEQPVEDEAVKHVVINSLKTRWGKTDQDVFIATVILNPFVKTGAFKQIRIFTRAGIAILLHHLWHHFYPDTTVSSTLKTEIDNYLDNKGQYSDLQEYTEMIQVQAVSEVSRIHLSWGLEVT
ncbi:hypothetical protein GLOTRDRAFT_37090 [Gloeophyllum trabeum ATCC 11539]|uniref:Uncharacterized protein n=1 Tax=Gloeophyllum trabeum (strain ATCC 11539 / FP-39264 / Madison 617) TaxID=670483 RepID=S7QFD8_GLOTA|nr:uncharacterized protein GLOTRDRAFT_37090 [Gloeophyllum trabeum ATCC 11539]EPQ58521.1 hypothetical protein GLOTRDRAFT_37090 [Gloeophyllum trabeum ATCC 11539]